VRMYERFELFLCGQHDQSSARAGRQGAGIGTLVRGVAEHIKRDAQCRLGEVASS